MPRGPETSAYNKGQIMALSNQGLSVRQIAANLGIHRSTVHYQIKHPPDMQRSAGGRKRKLSDRDQRHIIRSASNKMTSAKRIRHDLDLEVSVRTVGQILQQSQYLSYDKMKRGPWSNPKTKRQRMEWYQQVQNLGPTWNNVIFSDEKKFNLDGPDGLNCYWHDLRKEKLRFSKRQQGGGGIMFWGGIGSAGKTPLVRVNGKMDSRLYQQCLRENLLPNAVRIGGQNWIFQQDGASCHRSQSTKRWLTNHNVELLPWAPYSPDMNIVENLWGIMARMVYRDGKVYSSLQELETACRLAWDDITQDLIDNLFNSIERRIEALRNANGGFTEY